MGSGHAEAASASHTAHRDWRRRRGLGSRGLISRVDGTVQSPGFAGVPCVAVTCHTQPLWADWAGRSEEAVVGGLAEVDGLRQRMPGLALGIAPLHRYGATNEAVELAVVLQQRRREVAARRLAHRAT
jgi:hypothetical protein